MEITDELILEAVEATEQGQSLASFCKERDLVYGTVNRRVKIMRRNKEKGDVLKLHAAAQQEANSKAIQKIANSLPSEITEGLSGLQLLDTNLQNQACRILELLDNHLAEDDVSLVSLEKIVGMNSKIRDAYFNQKGIVINNQQNNLTQLFQDNVSHEY